MRSECWNCGRESEFEDIDQFVEEGWTRIGVGKPGRYGTLDEGEQRDFCFNCIELIDVIEQTENMALY